MKNVYDVLAEPQPDKIPANETAWLALDGVREVFEEVGGNTVSCGVFEPSSDRPAKDIAVFVGGVPRSEERRSQLPVVNKFFGYVAAGLAVRNTVGISFNWPGIGRSQGMDILDTSIDDRCDFLEQFTHHLMKQYNAERISFIGASMGAYCAALTADRLDSDLLKKMAFLSPAAYPVTAHHLPYNKGFGDELRTPWEPLDSPIHSTLLATESPTLIGFSEYDDPPIPMPIQKMFQILTTINPNVEYHTIKGVYHNFRRTPEDSAGNAVDNASVRQFGDVLIEFLDR